MHNQRKSPKTDEVAASDREQQEFCAEKVGK